MSLLVDDVQEFSFVVTKATGRLKIKKFLREMQVIESSCLCRDHTLNYVCGSKFYSCNVHVYKYYWGRVIYKRFNSVYYTAEPA